jgi:hypothetical protein
MAVVAAAAADGQLMTRVVDNDVYSARHTALEHVNFSAHCTYNKIQFVPCIYSVLPFQGDSLSADQENCQNYSLS